jgi:hypothetical protein
MATTRWVRYVVPVMVEIFSGLSGWIQSRPVMIGMPSWTGPVRLRVRS